MQTIVSVIGLKDAILQLEEKQAVQGRLLKENVVRAYESLKPLNLIKAFSERVASPGLFGNIITAAMGLAAGYFTDKIPAGSSVGGLKKLLINTVLLGITTFVAKNPEITKILGERFLRQIFRKD